MWRGRARSRDRASGYSQPPPRIVRTVPAGIKEATDFLKALEDCTDRLDAIERNHRMLAQTVSTEIESSKTVRTVITDIKRDVDAYKVHITGRFARCEEQIDSIKTQAALTQSLLDSAVQSIFILLNDRVGTIEAAIMELRTRNT